MTNSNIGFVYLFGTVVATVQVSGLSRLVDPAGCDAEITHD